MNPDPSPTDATKLRANLTNLSLSQSGLAEAMAELGDKRELKSILRSIQRIAAEDSRLSGEMQVILTLLARQQRRARRIAAQTEWKSHADGRLTAEVQEVRLTLRPQSKGRWSIVARYLGDGPDGYSPEFPHWRESLEAAKIRAILAVDEALDDLEAFDADGSEAPCPLL